MDQFGRMGEKAYRNMKRNHLAMLVIGTIYLYEAMTIVMKADLNLRSRARVSSTEEEELRDEDYFCESPSKNSVPS